MSNESGLEVPMTRAGQPGPLQDTGPSRARGAVQQHDVGRCDADRMQQLGRGRAGQDQPGGGGKAQRRRLGEHIVCPDADLGRVAAGDLGRDHLVAGNAATAGDLGSRPGRADDPGNLEAERQRQQRGVLAGRDVLVVGRVHAGGPDIDDHEPGRGRRDIRAHQFQRLRAAEPGRLPLLCHPLLLQLYSSEV
jgi:hypothetical protein